ncbi:MAG TPA: hypothetical protein ENK79_02680 [Campylobacterales bacterium]|nr:hypothetical protein [Campylobacterales bacterium]
MFKFFLLLIVGFVVYIGTIKYISSDNKTQESYPKEIIVDDKKVNIIEEDIEYENQKSIIKPKYHTDNRLKDEIKSLFEQANNFALAQNYQEAIKIYNNIIDKLQDTKDNKLLKSFAKAHFLKAYIYRNNIHDNDEAIKDYNAIIEKFKNSDDVSLLKLYYNAQTVKAYLLDKDEAIDIYDEIINKFKNSNNVELLKKYIYAQYSKSYLSNTNDTIDIYDEIIDKFKNSTDKTLLKELASVEFSKARLLNDYLKNPSDAIDIYDDIINQFENYDENEFKQVVANALFAKSYLLMKDNGEESMEILDELIDRYKNSTDKELARNFEYSVINNIELALITNNDDTNYRDLANKYLYEKADTKPQLEMLEILKNAQEDNQDEALRTWEKKYKDYKFEDWSFEELQRWNNDMENSKEKNRIKRYLNEFIKHDATLNPVQYHDKNSTK